jgi:hypothetical protein
MASEAMGPRELDGVFRGSDGEIRVRFSQAVEAAIQAKSVSEPHQRNVPGLMTPSPGQAARQKFLAALGGATFIDKG